MSISRWLDELNVVYPSSGMLFSHNKGWMLTRATTWMILENVMLNERSQSAKATHFVSPLISDVQNRQIQMTGCWERGQIRGWSFVIWHFCLGRWNVLKLIVSMVVQLRIHTLKHHWVLRSKWVNCMCIICQAVLKKLTWHPKGFRRRLGCHLSSLCECGSSCPMSPAAVSPIRSIIEDKCCMISFTGGISQTNETEINT